ncbi:hypothetical protein M408DRAFT_203577 [Serendipita vermifera MAFF 305830]|uniref:Uncharacterized protein n=1 Tax=Serendipita vermifera MAFF 305830 TaxID=933852 RepID=A0A0C3B0L6_SERVB|nr:hypothetical protein M408DRAFT_203577 [Serendipita vermifera MAFF 305830]
MTHWGIQVPAAQPPAEKEALIKDKYLPLLSDQCKAIISPGHWASQLRRLDHIVMLNYIVFTGRDPTVDLSSLSTKYANLQHLQVFVPTLIIPGAHIELPFLRILSVTIGVGGVNSEIPTPLLPSHLGVWNLPKLCYLEVDSVHATVWRIKLLHFLLTQVGKAITHFHLVGYILAHYQITETRLFDNFGERQFP